MELLALDDELHSLPTGKPARFLAGFGIVLLIALLPMARFVQMGEVFPEVALGSIVGPVLYGTANGSYAYYKLTRASQLRPAVLVLGNSRVMGFRKEMFARCASVLAPRTCFYNAGGALPTFQTGLDFLSMLPADAWPHLILLGVDIWHVNPNALEGAAEAEADRRMMQGIGVLDRLDLERSRSFGALKVALRNPALLRAMLSGRQRETSDGLTPVGLAAVGLGSGFRPDGSYDYGPGAEFLNYPLGPEGEEFRLADGLHRVAARCCRFEPFDRVDGQEIEALRRTLRLAEARGATVVAFTLPFPDGILEAVHSDPVELAAFRLGADSLNETFTAAGIPLASFERLSDVSCAPNEHIDGVHLGEPCLGRVLLRLVDLNPELAAFVDRMQLISLLKMTPNPYSLDHRGPRQHT